MIEFVFLVFFFIDAIIHLFGAKNEYKTIIYISKPLLMPLLALYFTFGSIALENFNWLIIVALLCGCVGDTCLIFKHQKSYFLTGMVSFLCGHVFYIISFLSSLGSNFLVLLISAPLLILPALVILYLLYPKIKDGLGDMKLPVFIYVGVIFLMHLSAILRVTGIPIYCPCFIFVYLGSFLFIFSDSLIALDKFNQKKINHFRI